MFLIKDWQIDTVGPQAEDKTEKEDPNKHSRLWKGSTCTSRCKVLGNQDLLYPNLEEVLLVKLRPTQVGQQQYQYQRYLQMLRTIVPENQYRLNAPLALCAWSCVLPRYERMTIADISSWMENSVQPAVAPVHETTLASCVLLAQHSCNVMFVQAQWFLLIVLVQPVICLLMGLPNYNSNSHQCLGCLQWLMSE